MNTLYGENRFYRHVASHWIEMQQALIAMIIGGVFEFHPKLRVGFLEAQNSWAPGLLSRIEWDYPQYRDTHAPYLSLTPREYFRRNCWAAVEGSEPEIEATAGLIGADRMCISTDYPHFDSNFPHVSEQPAEERAARDRRADLHGRRAPLRVHRGRLQEGRRRGRRPEGLAMSWNGETVIDLDSHIVERADRFYEGLHRSRLPRALPARCARRSRGRRRRATAYSLFGSRTSIIEPIETGRPLGVRDTFGLTARSEHGGRPQGVSSRAARTRCRRSGPR